ncbi:MAG: hypothetical protein ACYS1A_17080, partial [Planctomycetota bacterium]
AAANGILTGKVSSHGSPDSCKFHEGRIVFFSEGAKEEFIKQFPKITEARSWPTIQHLQTTDPTHIFKPNCRHVVTAFPFYLFDEADVQEELKANPSTKIPKNPEKAVAAVTA